MEVEMLLNQDPDVVEAIHQQSGRTALAVASQYVLLKSVSFVAKYMPRKRIWVYLIQSGCCPPLTLTVEKADR